MEIQINADGVVSANTVLFANSNVIIEYVSIDDIHCDPIISYNTSNAIVLQCKCALTSQVIPMPSELRVTCDSKHARQHNVEPWPSMLNPMCFLLLQDRAYSVWMDNVVILQTLPATKHTVIEIKMMHTHH